MANDLKYFPDDEDSEWLANINPSFLDDSNEEKQFDDKFDHLLKKIPRQFCSASYTYMSRISQKWISAKLTLTKKLVGVFDKKNLSLNILLCSIPEYFYSLLYFDLTYELRVKIRQNSKKYSSILHNKTFDNIFIQVCFAEYKQRSKQVN